MKYKIGDKVKIRKDLKVGKLYGTCVFVEKMKDSIGKIARITEVNEHYGEYRISPYPCWWTDEMFEDVDMETQKKNKRIVIDADGNKVIAYCGDKKGVARCHPDDAFDFYIGAKLALERLEDAEKPYGWLKEGTVYYISSVIHTNLYESHIYDADVLDKKYMKRGIVFKTKEEAIACAKKMLTAVKQEG